MTKGERNYTNRLVNKKRFDVSKGTHGLWMAYDKETGSFYGWCEEQQSAIDWCNARENT